MTDSTALTREQVERFDESDCSGCGLPIAPDSSPEGKFVLYTDYAALRERIIALEKMKDLLESASLTRANEIVAIQARLATVEGERNKCEAFLARIASLRIDETGTACFSNATDGRGIDAWRVAEQVRQWFQQAYGRPGEEGKT